METYSPVAKWFSIRTLLTMSSINKRHSRQVESIQLYPQEPIKYDLYTELTKDFKTKDGNRRTHVP